MPICIFTQTGLLAYNTILEALKNKQASTMIEEMKLDLEAILEDEAQKWINEYLRSEILENTDDKINEEVLKLKDLTQVLESMIDKTDIRYPQMLIKKIFFEAQCEYSKSTRDGYLAAITKLENINELLPNQAWILENLGENYIEVKQYDKAEKVIKKAMELSPNWPDTWINLGNMYSYQFKDIEAEKAYKKAIELGLYGVMMGIGINYMSSPYLAHIKK